MKKIEKQKKKKKEKTKRPEQFEAKLYFFVVEQIHLVIFRIRFVSV